MEQSEKLVGVFQGSWLSEDGEHVATIEGFEIQWPDGSSKQLALDETDEDRFTFELEDQVFGGRLVSEDRLEFTDGDIWLRARKVEAKPKRKSAPRKPPVPLDGTEAIKPKRKAAPRKRKAPAEEKAKKFKVTSKNKVGILSKPEIEAEVKTYLMPGAVFLAEEEWVDPRDERKYFFITAEHGWVPQCSRKDPSKIVVEEQISKAKRARMEAEQAAAAAAALEAAKAAEEAAASGEPEVEEGAEQQQAEEKVEEVTAAAADVAAEEAAPPTPKVRAKAKAKAVPAPITKEELEDKVLEELEGIDVDGDLLKTVEGLVEEGEIAAASCEQCCRLMKLPLPKLKAMLKSAWLPVEGPQQRLAVRLVRFLSDLGPCGEDVGLFEAAGLPTAPPTRRLRGKHKAPPAPVPSKPPAPVKSARLWGWKPRVSRPKKTPKVMTVEDLVDSGKIPEESAERYEALSGAEMSELQEMAESLELPSEGTPQQLAFRIVRCLAGLPPASDAALGKTPKAPVRKAAAAKPKLRAGKLGGASRLWQKTPRRAAGRSGKAGRGRRVATPKLRMPKPDLGPSKAKLRAFLVNFLSDADVENTTIGQLKEAAKEEFDLMTDEAIRNLRELAAVEMRKQLTARRRKKPRMEEVEDPPQEPGPEADPEAEAQEAVEENTEPAEPPAAAAAEAPEADEARPPAEEEKPQDPVPERAEDSDSDSCSISPFDMALLASPAPGLRSPGPSGLRSPGPARSPAPLTPAKQQEGSPKHAPSKSGQRGRGRGRGRGEAQPTGGASEGSAPQASSQPKAQAEGKAKAETKSKKATPPKVKKDLPTKASERSKPASAEERKGQAEEKRSQNSFVFVSSGTGHKLEDNIDDDQQLLKLAELRQKEAAERRRRSMEMIVFDGIQTTLAKFVQHSIVHADKHALLQQAGQLSCKIKVPAVVWSSDLENRLRSFVSSFGGDLSQDTTKDKPSRSEKSEKVRLLRAKLAAAKSKAEAQADAEREDKAEATAPEAEEADAKALEAQETRTSAEADTEALEAQETRTSAEADAEALEAQETRTSAEAEAQEAEKEKQPEEAEAKATEAEAEVKAPEAQTQLVEASEAQEAPQVEAEAKAPEAQETQLVEAEAAPPATQEAQLVEADVKATEAEKPEEAIPTAVARLLEEGGMIPTTPGQIPGTPQFLGVKPAGREAPGAIVAAGHAVQRAYAGPVSKWMISLDAPALQHYVFKHPQVVGVTDQKLEKFSESFAAKADITTVKIHTFLKSLERRFGEQLEERKPRILRVMTEFLQKRVDEEKAAAALKAQEEGTEDQEPEAEAQEAEQSKTKAKGKAKAKAKGKAKAKPKASKSMDPQKERKNVSTAGSSKKNAPPKEDPDHVKIKEGDERDLMWAARVLAPFGMTEGGEIVVKPPVNQALPLMKSLRQLSTWTSLKQHLQKTKLGRVVNALRRHPDSEVAGLARELMESWKEACQQQLRDRASGQASQSALTEEGAEQ